MCIETHTRHRRCAHTRFLRWDYCSILIPTDRLPTTGRACRRYKLRFQDAKKGEECVECLRWRVVAEHTPSNSPTASTFPLPRENSPRVSLHAPSSPGFFGNVVGWLNAPASDPVPTGVAYGALPTTTAHATSSTWGAMSNIRNSGESRARSSSTVTMPPQATTIPPPAPTQHSVYGQGDYDVHASEEVQTERMTLAELLRTPPPSSFPRVDVGLRGGDGSGDVQPVVQRVSPGAGVRRQFSAFPAPMRGDERVSGWKAPESWGVGGSQEAKGGEEKENEKGGEGEGKEKKKVWFKGMFKYREGYTGGAI